MGSLLGFHPPHFSEDAAWLPAWLQPSSASKSPWAQEFEETGRLQQSINTRENEKFSDDSRRMTFHLFLSGEDNSPMNFPSCSSNHEVQFNLRLSSNIESQYSLSPILSTSQSERFKVNEALVVQHSEDKVIFEKDICELNNNANESNIFPSEHSGNLRISGYGSQSERSKSNQALLVQQPENKVIFEDICELNNFANESNVFPSEHRGSLRVSDYGSQSERSKANQDLLVQQPENKVILEKDTCELNNNANECIVFPSEHRGNFRISGYECLHSKEQKKVNPKVDARSHKVDINDAVELAVAASEALTIHELVKDEIPIASAVLEAAIRMKQARLEESKETLGSSVEGSNEMDLDFDFLSDSDELTMADAYEDVGLIATKHGDVNGYGSISHVKDSYASESYISNAGQKCNELAGLEVDSHLISPKEQHKQQVGLQSQGLANGDLTSIQAVRSSLKSGSSGCNETEDKITNLVPDRFQSRWFGGWTSKNEASIPAVGDDKFKENVPDFFANETSYLSESAPDQNSCIQKHENECNITSQISVAPERTYDNKASSSGNLVIDDVSASPIDPLCSVVPCSFASNNEPNVGDNLERVLPEIEVQSISNVNDEVSPVVRRQVASLKTYSMLNAMCDPYLDKEHTRGESLPVEQRVDQSNVKIDGHNETAKGDTELTVQMAKDSCKSHLVPRRKRVRFAEPQIISPQAVKKLQKVPKTSLRRKSRSSEGRTRVTDNKMLFQDLKFLLTGFSVKKHKEIKNLIQKNGGIVIDDIPSSTSRRKRCSKIAVILCSRRLLTTKFLYGCAVNACILKVKWLFDSLDEGLILPPKKYMVLREHSIRSGLVIGRPVSRTNFIFDDVAVMLHGKPDFCCKMAKVIKHGGGLVFKTFHWLVKSLESRKVSLGAIVVEDENGISRQLKQCTLEQKIPMVPFKWIIDSLYAGRLLPSPQLKLPDHNTLHVQMSEEI